jgi:hypothetical protein
MQVEEYLQRDDRAVIPWRYMDMAMDGMAGWKRTVEGNA